MDNSERYNYILQNVVELYLRIYPKESYTRALVQLIFDGIEYGDYESSEDTVKRILFKIKELINKEFPSKSTLTQRILRANIISSLEFLELSKQGNNHTLL